jgi:hypothetical protein
MDGTVDNCVKWSKPGSEGQRHIFLLICESKTKKINIHINTYMIVYIYIYIYIYNVYIYIYTHINMFVMVGLFEGVGKGREENRMIDWIISEYMVYM